ncbi:MAG: glycosyltransferase family 4 protein [Pseudothermotoga sp.]
MKERIGGKHVHQEFLFEGLKELGVNVQRLYFPGFSFFTLASTRVVSFVIRSYAVSWRVRHMIDFFHSGPFADFDIVHSHDVVSAYGVNATNLVLTVHGYFAREVFDYSDYLDRDKDRRLFEWLLEMEKRAVQKAKKMIAVDSRIKQYLIGELGVSQEKVIVLYNAIDDKTFAPISEVEKTELRKKLKIPEKAFTVLLARRFVPKNGVLYAAEAFSKLKSDEYFFVIAGGGKLKGDMLKLLKENRNFVLYENLSHDKIADYYKACDMVLVPSVTSTDVEEATSLAMLEGMACGKIVVCTKVGGMKEVIKHMENGILIEQKDVQAIVDAIEYVKGNYKQLEHVRRKAREHVVQNHGYLNYAKKVVEIYQEVLNDNRV